MIVLEENQIRYVAGGNLAEASIGLFVFSAPLIIGAGLGYYVYSNYLAPLIQSQCNACQRPENL